MSDGSPTRAMAAAAGAAIVGTAVVPLTAPGLGWPLAGLAVAAAVWVNRGPVRPRWPQYATAGLCLVLLAVGVFRAADWLLGFCVLAAIALASLALRGSGPTWRRELAGIVALPAAVVRSARWAATGLPDRERLVSRRTHRVVRGVLIGSVLLVVFGGLFAGADPVFADLLRRATPHPSPDRVFMSTLLFVVVGGLTLGAIYLAVGDRAETDPEPDEPEPVREGWRLLDWAIPLALLDALFAVFVTVQITVLFGGHEYVLGPGGPTYAEYARNGFWQLGLATVLTLAVVAAVGHFAARVRRGDRVAIRVLGGALCVLALVVVASALRRMALYADAYGFTRPRLIAYTGELWLGLLFGLLLVAGLRLGPSRWLPRAATATAVAVLLGLVAINPDAYVARTVIDRFRHDGHLDASYLMHLSADAVAEIDRLPEPQRSCALVFIAQDLKEPDPWYAFNTSRQRARALLAAHPVPPDTVPCEIVFR
jgi:Domain of unknown function (DUF4153)